MKKSNKKRREEAKNCFCGWSKEDLLNYILDYTDIVDSYDKDE